MCYIKILVSSIYVYTLFAHRFADKNMNILKFPYIKVADCLILIKSDF